MSSPATRAAVPDGLLAPLLDAAAEVLREIPPGEVPAGLRTLAGFDRRGLANATARHQLRRAFDLDDGFRERVVAAFVARAEVQAVLEGYSADAAVSAAAAAAARDDLQWWASALYAGDPPDAEFGLGVACCEDQARRDARARHDDLRAATARAASAEEARRRADAALATARADLARLEAELRDERRSRRDREAVVERRSDDAARAVREAEAALERSRREGELAEARAHREAERAREAERRLRELRREATGPPTPVGPDPEAIADAARRARDLAGALERIAGSAPRPPAGGPVAAGPPAARRERRAPVPCPPGLAADDPDALEAMLRTPGVLLVVDGYNVSMTGWPGVPVAQQRDRLVSALVRLHLRLRCHALVVFDGADVVGVPVRRTPGVRVVFSAAGEEADPVIVREVRSLGAHVPVVVASSDRWVHDEATGDGATVVPADTLLAVLRR